MLTPESAARKDISSGYGDMQHRHFATIAAIIRNMGVGRGEAAAHFAKELRRTNPRFDAERFLRACEA